MCEKQEWREKKTDLTRGGLETEQRKEARHFNNSLTPASFRIKSSPKTGPMCPPHMTHHPQWLFQS